jgi:hypothetical protein
MIQLQSKREFLKQKNGRSPLRDQSTNHVDKHPKNKDKNTAFPTGRRVEKSKNSVNKSKKV